MSQALNLGKVVALPDVMSVYNRNMPNGAVSRNFHKGIDSLYKAYRDRIRYFRQYDEQTGGKYHNVIETRIAAYVFATDFDEESLFWASDILRKSDCYYMLEAETGLAEGDPGMIKRLWRKWKYRGSAFGKLWYWSMLLWRRLNEYRYGHR